MNSFRHMKLKLSRRDDESIATIDDKSIATIDDKSIFIGNRTNGEFVEKINPEKRHRQDLESEQSHDTYANEETIKDAESRVAQPSIMLNHTRHNEHYYYVTTPPPSPPSESQPKRICRVNIQSEIQLPLKSNQGRELHQFGQFDVKRDIFDPSDGATMPLRQFLSPVTTDEEDSKSEPGNNEVAPSVVTSQCFDDSSSCAENNLECDLEKSSEIFKCGFCDRNFSYLCHLKVHERVHTGEKPYSCKYCSAQFSQLGSLTVHMRIHTGERPYRCGQCSKTFRHVNSLRRHQRQVHSSERNSPRKNYSNEFKIEQNRYSETTTRAFNQRSCNKFPKQTFKSSQIASSSHFIASSIKPEFGNLFYECNNNQPFLPHSFDFAESYARRAFSMSRYHYGNDRLRSFDAVLGKVPHAKSEPRTNRPSIFKSIDQLISKSVKKHEDYANYSSRVAQNENRLFLPQNEPSSMARFLERKVEDRDSTQNFSVSRSRSNNISSDEGCSGCASDEDDRARSRSSAVFYKNASAPYSGQLKQLSTERNKQSVNCDDTISLYDVRKWSRDSGIAL